MSVVNHDAIARDKLNLSSPLRRGSRASGSPGGFVNRRRIERLLGVAKLELERFRRSLAKRHGAVKARTPSRVTRARPFLVDLDQHRILIAVDAHLGDALHMTGGLALAPQAAARAAEVPRLAALDG